MTDPTPLIITDAASRALGSISDYSLELSYGDDDCDFSLSEVNAGIAPVPHGKIYIDGSRFGGVIDTISIDNQEDEDLKLTYMGRTMQGIALDAVIEPDAGNSHRVVSGTLGSIMEAEIARCGLAETFTVMPCAVNIASFTFRRYIDLYRGLRMLCDSVGYRLAFEVHNGAFCVSAAPYDSYGTAATERVYYNFDRVYRPVNGLIGLGKGEGAGRAISKWYADEDGDISRTQTLKGIDARILTYQLNSEDQAGLDQKTKEKLEEYQRQDQADISLGDDADLDVGDKIRFSDAANAIDVELAITRVVLKATEGICKVGYEFGTPEWPEEED